MVCWEEQNSCHITADAQLTIRGDKEAPVNVQMRHRFEGTHHQTHEVAPLEHTLEVPTALARPIHHALQMRTPLQLRFCNTWHLASDYNLEIRLGDNRVAALRLTGATVASPQPCEEPCPEPKGEPEHR